MRFRKKAIPLSVRRQLAERHGCMLGQVIVAPCARCGLQGRIYRAFRTTRGRFSGWVTFPGLEIDHIVPEFKGGISTIANVQLLCRFCNRSKGHRDR